MRITLIIATILLFCQPLFSQHASIKGLVSDTSEHISLPQSSIMVLQQKDSFLISFSRADTKGAFAFSHLPAGSIILKISYPGYADYVTEFEMKDLGDAKKILGMEITRDREKGTLTVSQEDYAWKVLGNFNMKN